MAARRAALDAAGTQVAFVHMHPETQAEAFFDRYGVGDLPRVSDPDQALYRTFGLAQVTPAQWFDPRVLGRYLQTIWAGHRPALVGGNVLRMPGAFLIVGGRVVKAFRPATVAERLDLDDLTTCPIEPSSGARA